MHNLLKHKLRTLICAKPKRMSKECILMMISGNLPKPIAYQTTTRQRATFGRDMVLESKEIF